MLSKKFSCNWFSFGIWRKQTFRFWPIWASYLAIWLLVGPQILQSNFYGADHVLGLDADVFYFGRAVIRSLPGTGMLLAVYAILVAMAVYSYLYNHRSVNLFHALPVRRETLFVTNFVTGLSFLVVPNLIVTLYFGLLQSMQNAAGDPVPVLTWFAVTTLMSVFFFGLATLCATATATILMLPVLYGIFNFLVVVIEGVVRWLASMFLWGVTDGYLLYQKWSPLAYIVGNGFKTNGDECVEYLNSAMRINAYLRFEDWNYVLLMALAGLLCAVGALLLYRRWHSEAAGDIIAFSFLRPVFTYAWAAGCSLMLGSFFFMLLGEGSILGYLFGYASVEYESSGFAAILFTVCMLMGGTLGYFSAQMLHKKSFRVFSKKDWKGYGAFVLALLALVLCIRTDVFGIERWTPDAEDIVGLRLAGELMDETQFDDVVAIHRAILEQRETLQAQVADYDDDNAYVQHVRFQYQLKGGHRITRQYALLISHKLAQDPTTPVGMLFDLLEGEEQRLERLGLEDFGTPAYGKIYVSFSPYDDSGPVEYSIEVSGQDKLNAMLEVLEKDVAQGTLGAGDIFSYLSGNGKDDSSKFWAEVSIFSQDQKEVYCVVDQYTPNTIAWVKTQLEEYLAQKDVQIDLDQWIAGVK